MRRLTTWVLLLILTVPGLPRAQQGGMGPGPGVKSYSGGVVPFVDDTFTGSDGTLLSAHTGETGATWTKHSSFTEDWAITSNRARKDSNAGTSAYYASGTPASTTYNVQCVIVDVGNVSRAAGCCGRIDTAADNMVCARRQNATTWQVLTIIGGTAASLDTEPTTFSAGASATITMVFTGSTLAWSKDGVTLGSGLDLTTYNATFAGAGRVGVRGSNDHSGTGYHIDRITAW